MTVSNGISEDKVFTVVLSKKGSVYSCINDYILA